MPDTLTDTSQIAISILGPVDWIDESKGYCRCPGAERHTHPSGKRDCRVMLDRVPTIHCVHNSCRAEIIEANYALRSAIGKASTDDIPKRRQRPTPEEKQRLARKLREERIEKLAEVSLKWILHEFASDPADFFDASPVRLLDDVADDWKLVLKLFSLDDVVWIGGLTDSCDDSADEEHKTKCRRHFRTVREWLVEQAVPSPHICPANFKNTSHSRCASNIICRRFLVVESDTLTKKQICAVFRWMQQFLKLRAVVDTAGKSLHGWFDFPSPEVEAELKLILPKLLCDRAMLGAAQPCRLPGAWREVKDELTGTVVKRQQALIYLDFGVAQ